MRLGRWSALFRFYNSELFFSYLSKISSLIFRKTRNLFQSHCPSLPLQPESKVVEMYKEDTFFWQCFFTVVPKSNILLLLKNFGEAKGRYYDFDPKIESHSTEKLLRASFLCSTALAIHRKVECRIQKKITEEWWNRKVGPFEAKKVS